MNLLNLPQKHNVTSRQKLGSYGENLACEYLVKHGYAIVERNFKKRYGELDIVCLYKGILVFIEVKTRIGRMFGLPEESVTPRKLHEVKQTALYYKLLHPELPDALRIDVIGIELDEENRLVYFNHIVSVTS